AGTDRTYFHYDPLGSLLATSHGDANNPATLGTLKERFSYDAWGKARSPDDWHSPASPDRSSTDRGFTAHQMLDELGLIHMNGRIYDPDTARFLSPDPYLQAPANFQNYNRYSYVLNNPVSMTDPSGHFFFFVAAIISSVVSAAVAITSYALAAISTIAGPLAGALGITSSQLFTAALLTYGAISSYQAGGFKGLVLFAATAFVTAGIGKHFDIAQFAREGFQSGIELARAVTHGIVQGGFAELQGGDFGSSFLSGFTGSIAGSMINAKSGDKSFFGAKNEGGKYLVRRTVAAAVVGGTTSEIAGGKFANGAMSAAMVHLLNHEISDAVDPSELSTSEEGIDFIAEHEGFSPTVYNDQAGHPTIGFGHKLTPSELKQYRAGNLFGNGISRAEGKRLLALDVGVAENAVRAAVNVPVTQCQFDALVSFTYNVGGENLRISTLVRILNQGNYAQVGNEMARWIYAGGNVSRGLMRRRFSEAWLWHGSYTPLTPF
ncbi:MAG: glycoside hydrolase family protein, partial [Opitutales bacterium]